MAVKGKQSQGSRTNKCRRTANDGRFVDNIWNPKGFGKVALPIVLEEYARSIILMCRK